MEALGRPVARKDPEGEVAKFSVVDFVARMEVDAPSAQNAVTREQIIIRGLTLRCPNCGAKSLYPKGIFFRMNRACSSCGMRWDKDEAAFLGSTAINYGVTAFGFILPWIIISSAIDAPTLAITGVAIVLAVAVPILLYRAAKSWWLMCYYLALPAHLPANWDGTANDRPPDE